MVDHKQMVMALIGVFTPGGCTTPPPLASPPAPSAAVPAEPSPDSTAETTGSRLPRHRTDEPIASLTIVSDYPIAQQVFVDGEPIGAVAPGETATFTVPEGVHRVVCADSEDPSDNATEIEETFDLGYGYTYRLHAR
jgi:hypothetical protein